MDEAEVPEDPFAEVREQVDGALGDGAMGGIGQLLMGDQYQQNIEQAMQHNELHLKQLERQSFLWALVLACAIPVLFVATFCLLVLMPVLTYRVVV